MAHRCKISGKGCQFGHRVSHAKNRTKHTFKANLQSRRLFVPDENRYIKTRVSTRILKTIDKIGLRATLKKHGMTVKDLER
ncbi:MAG: 50S ribosomal protein L28 [Bdellovibrionales bacterium]|nr:50S ribosomal protein L28 [Bdellovibrionales bacterium]